MNLVSIDIAIKSVIRFDNCSDAHSLYHNHGPFVIDFKRISTWKGCEQRYVMLCAIWYYLHNFKKVENTHGGELLSTNSKASACNFTKSNTPLWVFLNIFKL